MKKDFKSPFNTALAIAEKYKLNTNSIVSSLNEIDDFKITAPVIGGFSTGKSSLINALMGENLLPVNITPETAVPTEIVYGDDTVTVVDNNGGEITTSIKDFDFGQLSADTYSVVKIKTSNPFFAQIPSVKLVDMPGFDSGIEIHNKAIDEYLPTSLAYILTVSVDEGTLRESIITFLNELKIYDMPVYTVITKMNKVEPEIIDKLKSHIAETIKRFLKIENPKIAATNAKGRVEINEFQLFLTELQNDSDNYFNRFFSQRLEAVCGDIEKYLMDRLQNKDMSAMDLQMQKEQAEKNLSELNHRLEEEKSRFSQQIQNCISSIKNKISSELNMSSSMIESMLLQGQESAISEKINTIIRNAVAVGIQNELEPKVKKYVRNAENMIQVSVYGSSQIQLPESEINRDNEVKNSLINVTKTAIPIIATTIGGFFTGPLGAIIAGAAATLISTLISGGFDKKQEEKKQELAYQKAREIINNAAVDAGNKAENAIISYVDEINEQLETEINNQREIKTKALQDCEEKLRLSVKEKETENAMLNEDLEKIRGVRNGI